LDWHELARAFALVMVLEGVMPFLAPARWRQTMLTIAGMDSRTIRIIGLMSMLSGLVVLKLAT
jgi:uncharacterized protein YjeT (DUF2065 family)